MDDSQTCPRVSPARKSGSRFASYGDTSWKRRGGTSSYRSAQLRSISKKARAHHREWAEPRDKGLLSAAAQPGNPDSTLQWQSRAGCRWADDVAQREQGDCETRRWALCVDETFAVFPLHIRSANRTSLPVQNWFEFHGVGAESFYFCSEESSGELAG